MKKKILVYYTGYVNSLYLNFRHVNGYFEEINGNKFLMLVPTNKRKEKI